MQLKNYYFAGNSGSLDVESKRSEEEAEIDLPSEKANKCTGVLHNIIQSKHMPSNAKKRLYTINILLYGCEIWI